MVFTPENSSYEPITVKIKLTVAKAAIQSGLSVSLESWTYGSPAKTPLVTGNKGGGTVTYSYKKKAGTSTGTETRTVKTGNPDNSGRLTAADDDSYQSGLPDQAGEYTLKAVVAETDNYEGGEASCDFTIHKKDLEITAQAKTKVRGETDPDLTYTSQGLAGNDSLKGKLTREEGEEVGTYRILQGTLDAGSNYNTTYKGALLTITAPVHTHNYEESWSKDTSKHWHACTSNDGGECDAPKKDEADHTYGTEGDARFTCTVCGYVDAERKAAAEQADQGSSGSDQPDTPSDNKGKVSISGLENGDTVRLYKVIGWNRSTGWELEDPFTDIDSASQLDLNHNQVNIDTNFVNEINSKISSGTQTADTGSPNNGTFTSANLDPGMYIAIITSGKPGVIYNPIIVSKNFFKPDGPVDASKSSIPISGSEGSVAKKGQVTLEKTGRAGKTNDDNWQETVAVGDKITFTVTTVIPPFMTYLHPTFSLTDQLSSGLTYEEGSAKVTAPADLVKGNQYSVTGEGAGGYTLSFNESYLKSIGSAVPVTIEYKAQVTTEAPKSVNHENNTVTLEYSNNPNTSTDKAKLKDRTNHYTFDIDAGLLGVDNYEATELVKVGVDKDGKEITQSTTLSNTGKIGALQDAHFALYQADSEWKKIGDPIIADVKSGADGRITMKGLDAGRYLLIETKAPDGYIASTDPVQLEIQANVQPKEYTEDGCTINTDELVSYKVLVNGQETANYTITNNADPAKTTSDQGDTVVGIDGDKGKIKNIQGVALPSTGGPGTGLFTILGLMLIGMAGAGLWMKKMYN